MAETEGKTKQEQEPQKANLKANLINSMMLNALLMAEYTQREGNYTSLSWVLFVMYLTLRVSSSQELDTVMPCHHTQNIRTSDGKVYSRKEYADVKKLLPISSTATERLFGMQADIILRRKASQSLMKVKMKIPLLILFLMKNTSR